MLGGYLPTCLSMYACVQALIHARACMHLHVIPAMDCSAMSSNAQALAKQGNAAQCSNMQYNAKQFKTMQAISFETMQLYPICDVILCSTIQYN